MDLKYSTLMSIYNKTTCEELKLSVESMLCQTIKPDEFIIVCDGPVDDAIRETLQIFIIKNPGLFTIIDLEINSGLAVALNEGIKMAKNELIARMDSDDISLPTRCEKQLEEFSKRPELALLGTATKDFKNNPSEAKESVSPYPSKYEDIKRMMRRTDPFAHPTIMYKKSAVIACGGYSPELRRRQDYDLFSKMVNKGYYARNLSEALVLYKVDDANYIRMKSKDTCDSRVLVQKRLYERGECSFTDYLYIKLAMFITRILPLPLYKKMYNYVKRNEVR